MDAKTWIRLTIQHCLIGEIYISIRAIAIAYDKNKNLTIRYYLNRIPTDFDYESIESLANYICDGDSFGEIIKSFKCECIHQTSLMKDIDRLDEFVYARREYDYDKPE